MTELASADIQLIQAILPHRYPFLLVDRVEDIDGVKSARGIKNVTMNEPHFQGHFPGTPIMPGVTIIEALAQTAAVMVGVTHNLADTNMLIYFMSIDNANSAAKSCPAMFWSCMWRPCAADPKSGNLKAVVWSMAKWRQRPNSPP